MSKRATMLFLVCVFMILCSGCQTVSKAARGAGEGAQEDWENAKKVDSWMRKNLW